MTEQVPVTFGTADLEAFCVYLFYLFSPQKSPKIPAKTANCLLSLPSHLTILVMAAILAPLIRLSGPDLAPLSEFIKMPLFSHGRCGNVTFCGMNKSLWPSDCKIRNQVEVQTLTGRSRVDKAAGKATEASDWLKFESLFKLLGKWHRLSCDSATRFL